MYFQGEEKLASFYVLSAEKATLRGIFLVQADAKKTKNMEEGKWKSISGVEIEVKGKT